MYIFQDAIKILTEQFPEMKKIFEADEEEYFDVQYGFYETEFAKYITSKLRGEDWQEVQKIFDFVEDMFLNGDNEIKNLVGVAIVESIFFEKDFKELYPVILKYCGEKTKESFEDCINYRS